MRTNSIKQRFRRQLYSLLVLAILCLASGAALAVPKAELHVTPKYTGPGCCWDFELTQKWGAPGNITTVIAQIITPGVTVASASNSWTPAPSWTSTSINWTMPTAAGLNPTETVHACFDNNSTSSSFTIVFTGYDAAGNSDHKLEVDTVTVECKPLPHEPCFDIAEQKIECKQIPGTTQWGYLYSFYIKSHLNCSNNIVSVSVVSPAGVNVSPATFPIGVGFSPASLTISGPGATAGTVVTLKIRICCKDTPNQEYCCDDTVQIKLPECQPVEEGCFALLKDTVYCKQTPNGQYFAWCFYVKNNSLFNAQYFYMIPPAGVTISPATLVFSPSLPPGGVSSQQCVTISGPGATPGSTIVVYVRMCDSTRQRCCTQAVKVKLPECHEPPKDCCADFMKRFDKLVSSASANGNASIGGYVSAAGPGGTKIIAASATIVSASINGAPAWGYFTGGTIGVVGFGAGTLPSYSYPSDIYWGPTSPTTLALAPFTLKMKFPSIVGWHDVISYCVRFRFTDANCITCDTVICFKKTRFKIFHLDDVIKFPGATKRDEKGFARIANVSGSAICGALYSNDSGSMQITLPVPPQELGAITYTGIRIASVDGGVSIVDASLAEIGYNLIVANGETWVDFSKDPGTAFSFGFKYDALGSRTALAHRVTFRYLLAENPLDTLEEEAIVTLRRENLAGDDKVVSDAVDLRDVRTFALHLTNANGSQEEISRLVLTASEGTTIVAVGPTADQSQAVLQFGDLNGRKYVGEDMQGAEVIVSAGASHGPIYLTLAGSDNSTTVHFATLNADGQMISEGDVVLSSPLSSVKGVDGEASTGAVLRQSFPNPTGSAATIQFELPQVESNVTLVVTDTQGREVARLIDGESIAAGEHAVYFNTTELPSGTYYYTLRAGATMETRSMTVTR